VPKKNKKKEILATARSLAVAVFVALLFRSFVAEAYVIPTGSMEPSLLVGDRVVVSKMTYGMRVPLTDRWLLRWQEPGRGEVVIFSDPRGSGETLIKRVVALAGDRLEIQDNVVKVNSRALPRRALDGPCVAQVGTGEQVSCRRFLERHEGHRYQVQQIEGQPPSSVSTLTVPEGHCFVMGDNRDDSADSRFWGFLPYRRVRGRARWILWSWGDDGPRLGRSGQSVDG